MRLKELRKAQRYSQKHIAEMAGIQQVAVCRWAWAHKRAAGILDDYGGNIFAM